ncbi:MAG: YfhO family protein [Chloroflexi bacterium]|nr:YfhO family protein [Chloroflexota bacterium]
MALVDGLQLVHESASARIYLNEGYYPRAYAVPSAQIVANETEALLALQARPHTLGQTIILELEGQPAPPATSGERWAGGEVLIEAYGLNEVRLTAVMSAAGFVVLSDTYYPGWQATLNGQPTPIYRANSIVRAVFVPAGEHELIFTFWPADFVIGAVAATMGLGVVLIGLLVAVYTYSRHSVRL